MKKAPTVLLLMTLATPVLAHHAWPVDMDTLVTVQGTVTDFQWANPHPMITLQVMAAGGGEETWRVGGPAIRRMEAKGWTKDSVKPGDVITGTGYQFRDGQKIVRLESVSFADGTEMKVYGR
ncbi:MAG: DUF6152 family protein [Gammaproteobacteria bacterium]